MQCLCGPLVLYGRHEINLSPVNCFKMTPDMKKRAVWQKKKRLYASILGTCTRLVSSVDIVTK